MKDSSCANFRHVKRSSRREVLRAGSLGLLGLTLPELLDGRQSSAATPATSSSTFGKAKSCIVLFMWGGPAHQDTWDMKPAAPEDVRGEFHPIQTAVPDIHVCEHLPHLAKRTDKLCIVRSMTHTNADHTPSTHYLLTGEPPPRSTDKREQWPHMGAVLSKLGQGRGALPPFVSMRPTVPGDVPRFVEQSQGQFAGWLGPTFDPMTIDADPNHPDYKIGELSLQPELSVERLELRRDVLASLDRRLESKFPEFEAKDASDRRAYELLTSAASQRGAFDLHEEPAKVRERYGLNPHGQSVLQARRLVERGVPLVTVFWPNDGIKNVSVYWDTHSRNFIDLKNRLCPVADLAFSALLDDLEERGLLDETIVVWTGEFGRTPKVGQVNSDAGAGRDGRDHWPGCFTSVVAGGPFKRGFVYGGSDKHAAFPAASPVAPRDLIATIYHALGVGERQILPDMNGRPHFVRSGKAINSLFA